ncbi:hypothetical protein HYDPIDRAFT_36664 [Hydnomerulius pinastri MD-312]|nr:hypothetical protein HYDPIDRAFT_36664 [Hydnomerulius pinastri MD-312]
MAATGPSNSLGLNFDALQIKDNNADSNDAPPTAVTNDEGATQEEVAGERPKETKAEKKKPYVNLERVNTGGAQREKLTAEELDERMQRIQLLNEKIRQRTLDVKADEDAFKQAEEADRVKQAHTRKVQEDVDRTREQNAQRKAANKQSRAWDVDKPTGDWKQGKKTGAGEADGEGASHQPSRSTEGQGGKPRGGGRGGPSRGRGRGRGGPPDRGLAPGNAGRGGAPGATSPKPAESAPTSPAAQNTSS